MAERSGRVPTAIESRVATVESPTAPAPGTARGRPNGPAAAALLAGGSGAFALGLLIVLSEAIPGVRAALTWSNPVGPLSGKTGLAVLVWLAVWIVLHFGWARQRQVALDRVVLVTYILLGLGLVLSFPPVFEAFAAR